MFLLGIYNLFAALEVKNYKQLGINYRKFLNYTVHPNLPLTPINESLAQTGQWTEQLKTRQRYKVRQTDSTETDAMTTRQYTVLKYLNFR